MLKNTKMLFMLLLFCGTALLLVRLQTNDVAAAPITQSTSPLPPAPVNDNFGRAKAINSLPYSDAIDITYATRQSREPMPSCAYNLAERTIWYMFTAETDALLIASVQGYSPILGIYSGSSLGNLNAITCGWNYSSTAFYVRAGTTYYLQVVDADNYGGYVYLNLDVAPPIAVDIYTGIYDPSKYDTLYFYPYIYDPANQEIISWLWDFGDGATSTDSYGMHRYAADGDYTVTLTVTTSDGRSGTKSIALPIRTHDVSIKQVARPKSATVGQTKQLIISVANNGYPEDVTVELYKSVPGGYDYIGFSRQFVDVKAAGKTTDFYLNYTFTAADAALGKVIFKATAYPYNSRDAFPADNEFISYAVTVKAGSGGKNANVAGEIVASAALNDLSDYATDDVSNVDESLATPDDLSGGELNDNGSSDSGSSDSSKSGNYVNFLPLISSQQ